MLKRHFKAALLRKLKQFPIVTVLGPRQCGKTTFVRQVLPTWTYWDMEKPSDHDPLFQDPETRLDQVSSPLIIDEAQRLPALFPILRGRVDTRRKANGRYVLLGSVSPTLVRQVSESLAGRTTFLDMTPFQWDEVRSSRPGVSLESLWFRGGFPDAFLQRGDSQRQEWFEAYTRTFIERDLAALGIDVSSIQMRKLWTMLAHTNGGIWNASTLAASLGVSYHTVNRYTDILEHTFLIRKLPPYFSNIGKRLIKSPKIYFRDTGLLHYFLGIRDRVALDTHPARGHSWEAFLVEQVIAHFQLAVPGSQAYYWRTASGAEVDLLIDCKDRLIPFEIKRHSSPKAQDVRGLFTCLKDLKLDRGFVLYPGNDRYSLGGGVTVLSATQLLEKPSTLP